jgi:hypothetical protein
VSEPSEPPHDAPETRESNRRLVLSEDLPLTIFVGVATAVVFSVIDLGREWTLLGVATAPLVADAIKQYVRKRGWTKRRIVLLTALLVFFGRVKEAFARPFRRGSRPGQPPSGGGPAANPGWSGVAVTAAIGSALTIVFFTIPELARGEALLADRKTTFFNADRETPVAEEDGADTPTEPAPPPPPPPPSAPAPPAPLPPPAPPPPPAPGPTAALNVIIVGTGSGTGTVLIEPLGNRCEPTCEAEVPLGETVTLSAVPDEGSAFVAWKGGDCGEGDRCLVVMSKDQRVFAEFRRLPATFTLTVEIVADGGNGTVTSRPTGIKCPPTCSSTFAADTAVDLNAVSDSRSDFAGWGGDCTGSVRTCAVVMDADKSVTARFGPEVAD